MSFSFSVGASKAAVATYHSQSWCCCNQIEFLCALYRVCGMSQNVKHSDAKL